MRLTTIVQERPHRGTLYGWRWWWVKPQREAFYGPLPVTYHLSSIHLDELVTPRKPLRATCMSENLYLNPTSMSSAHTDQPKRCPVMFCPCGIYAFKSLADARTYWEGARDHVSIDFMLEVAKPRALAGRVALWGHVIEHERGYRAEYAYPAQFFCREPDMEWAGKVGETYGVPVTVFPPELEGLIP